MKLALSRDEYRDRVYACWLGKNVGGTLGTPHECKKEQLHLTFYDPVPDGALPNDDLDLQLVWLAMLEERGVHPSLDDFADYWLKHLSPYPWNEYGFCRRNLGRGLRPPISGCFENYYVDEMGSPIRSEIWACTAPGDPELAAELAWSDSAMDHAGGEGTCGEMFWAATQSAAFVETDPLTLIRIGLNMIPLSSNIARSIREAVWCRENEIPYQEAYQSIRRNFGLEQPCNAIQNHGFTILGWLYGQDFGDKLCKAVNCGYDTDCTGATLGATLGILDGTAGIPKKWSDPVGTGIKLHPYTKDLNAPKDIEELTQRTVAVAEKMLAGRSERVEFGGRTHLGGETLSHLLRNDRALRARSRDPQSTIARVDEFDLALHYGGEPVLRPGEDKTIGLSLKHRDEPVPATFEVVATGCEVQPDGTLLGRHRFVLRSHSIEGTTKVLVVARSEGRTFQKEFVILGPEEAKGFGAGRNVPTCPKCHAWIDACVC
ncbi:MAG TPA: ADP-ribosylglycohydrolase family protein [Fimbriimonas sp.]